MDTALKAMKRAAKALLKDELSALRKALRNNREAVAQLQAELAQARAAATQYSNQAGQLNGRASRAVAWAQKHAVPSGNMVALALTQWVRDGEPRGGSWTNTSCVHPFDRWNITPKPE